MKALFLGPGFGLRVSMALGASIAITAIHAAHAAGPAADLPAVVSRPILPATPALGASGPTPGAGVPPRDIVERSLPDMINSGPRTGKSPRLPLAAPDCVSARPALATTGTLRHTGQRLAEGAPLRILAIGSSTTEGVGASGPDKAYPAQLEKEINSLLPNAVVHMRVSGVGGETAVQTLARLERELAEHNPDLVIWQVGTNDALSDVGEDTFRTLLDRGIAAVKATRADLVLMNQQFFPSIRHKGRYERFVSMVEEAGLKRRACVFNRYALMQQWGASSGDTLKSMLSTDQFHMSDRGYACMARVLADEVVRAAWQDHVQTSAM